mmetsp:Transcript_17346/g.44053  ORF Transcript_17346/g.44053 Transcript_17346/m.44053 type:complete len:81 (-) Transcript_17346:60-302(-)
MGWKKADLSQNIEGCEAGRPNKPRAGEIKSSTPRRNIIAITSKAYLGIMGDAKRPRAWRASPNSRLSFRSGRLAGSVSCR